jgi:hypothetical protein
VVVLALSLGACRSAEEPSATSPAPQPAPTTASPSPTPSPSPSPSPIDEVPEPVVPEHGGTYWGVYLAVGEGPDVEDASAYLRAEGLDEGLQFGVHDIGCDQGAAEAIGSDGPLTVAVYFETEEDAEAWADTLPAPPLAIAEVQTYCLD